MRKQASKKSSVEIDIKRRRSDQAITKRHAEHGTAVRCKVCPKPAPDANFCCAKCSDELEGFSVFVDRNLEECVSNSSEKDVDCLSM